MTLLEKSLDDVVKQPERRLYVTERVPLYLPVKEAAEYAGIARNIMYEWVNKPVDHIPYIKCGKRRLVRVSAIAEYAKRMEAS